MPVPGQSAAITDDAELLGPGKADPIRSPARVTRPYCLVTYTYKNLYTFCKSCNRSESSMEFLNGDKGTTNPTLLNISVPSNDAVPSL